MHLVQPNPDMADRVEITYICPLDHEFTRVFAADATVPASWDCPRCGKNATTELAQSAEETAERPRTHWDMVLERRSLDELDDMLAERIRQLRGKGAVD